MIVEGIRRSDVDVTAVSLKTAQRCRDSLHYGGGECGIVARRECCRDDIRQWAVVADCMLE